MDLTKIDHRELKKLSLKELEELARRIREYIIEVVCENGGHLSSNLGVVELTIALHYVFDLDKDKILFDVGHQCYTHKILTGRAREFRNLRKKGGIAGFPKRNESIYDIFCSGHSGDAISVALGLSLFKKPDEKVIVVIGDGSIQSGVAFEGLNHCGFLQSDLIVILNDNEMSISKTQGAFSKYLNKIITDKRYLSLKQELKAFLNFLPEKLRIESEEYLKRLEKSLKRIFLPTTFFEEIGFRYFGPIDGHSLKDLIKIFEKVKALKGPILVHILTKKGKGYKKAEEDPEYYHGISGKESKNKEGIFYNEYVGKVLCEILEKRKDVVVITPGMRLGSGLKELSERFKERFFDCGICEQHTVDFACGLALRNLKPIICIYSTFLLRAYDQLINSCLLHNLPILFLIDRAGCVPEDGETHQGVYDISYLRFLPNITFFAPYFLEDLKEMIYFALEKNSPVFIRYPKEQGEFKEEKGKIEPEILSEGKDGILIGLGSGTKIAILLNKKLKEKGISFTLVDGKVIKPLPISFYQDLFKEDLPIFTIEDNFKEGGFGEYLKSQFPNRNIINFGFESKFLSCGKREEIFKSERLDSESLLEIILTMINKKANVKV
ncbi:MAG: 1-deoxy-D-xylulose-5-phosphate synthase [candidate division WOR-3 bacterium]|nr:1-deoxy-D-xylulose-5-phosphate synthase [candidate division WOR-3 bacterium]MCX7836537.1 1-deoxy-D-xylulose-5-phosphate synthase [candidate division WOR-3 bacterium]